MKFPDRKEIDRVKKKLSKVDPVRLLPNDAPTAERLKFELCKQFVTYLQKNNISQAKLAQQLDMDRSRLNEIIKYKIDLFTIDRLLEYTERLVPKLKVKVG